MQDAWIPAAAATNRFLNSRFTPENEMTQTIPETPPDYDTTRIIERPDGFYWQSRVDGREFGPFQTLLEAVQDMQYRDDSGIEAEENVNEAEDNIGISGWIDPDTGEPAEGNIPRVEDH